MIAKAVYYTALGLYSVLVIGIATILGGYAWTQSFAPNLPFTGAEWGLRIIAFALPIVLGHGLISTWRRARAALMEVNNDEA